MTQTKRKRPQFTVPKQMCPSCWHALEQVSVETSRKPPVEGDYTICIHCGAVLVFGESLKLRLPTESDAQLAASNQTIGLLRASVLRTIRRQEFQ